MAEPKRRYLVPGYKNEAKNFQIIITFFGKKSKLVP